MTSSALLRWRHWTISPVSYTHLGKFFLSPLKIILDKSQDVCYSIPCCWTAVLTSAGVAQPVEQLICNQQVGGSNPSTSSTISYGGVPEWPKGADCKSVAFRFGGSNPPSSTKSEQADRLLRLFLKVRARTTAVPPFQVAAVCAGLRFGFRRPFAIPGLRSGTARKRRRPEGRFLWRFYLCL